MRIRTDQQAKKAFLKYKLDNKFNDMELSKVIGISRNTIYKRMKTGKFTTIEKLAIEALINRQNK